MCPSWVVARVRAEESKGGKQAAEKRVQWAKERGRREGERGVGGGNWGVRREVYHGMRREVYHGMNVPWTRQNEVSWELCVFLIPHPNWKICTTDVLLWVCIWHLNGLMDD